MAAAAGALAESELRPDLKLYGDSVELIADVCITNPSSATYAKRAARKPLVAAKAMERVKRNKYKAIAAAERAEFLPFVVESYGAFGKSAERMMRGLAQHRLQHSGEVGAVPPAMFRSWAMSMMAAAVQRAHNMLVDAAHSRVRAAQRQRNC